MKTNVGLLDRLIRFFVAPAALRLFFHGERPDWEYAALAVGVIMALTAVVGFCPLHRLLGVNTCKKTDAA